MRVVGGSLRGRRFYPPAKIKARPTTDIAREALFNVLDQHIDFKGLQVLDLFFGTGGISLEFISRGAAEVIAIDIDIVSKKFLDQIVKDWELKNLRVVKADVFKLIKNPNAAFDLVFADPPYADPRFPELPDMILDSGWVKPGGWLILEHSDAHTYAFHKAFSFHKSYGSVNFSFFQKETAH
jgi:16S rRNA (guanine(966)-N(2))-methyltransferase RsmD